MEISALNKTPSRNLDSFGRDNDLWLGKTSRKKAVVLLGFVKNVDLRGRFHSYMWMDGMGWDWMDGYHRL